MADFRLSTSNTIRVPTMSSAKGLVRLSQGGTVVNELPFGGDAFVMTLVMPPAGTLTSFVDSLTPARWQSLLARLPLQSDTLLVQLPKFRLVVTRKLNDDFAALGMPSPFMRAQLNPMFHSPASNQALSQVVQKVFVDVYEEGAEAAAATAVEIIPISLPPTLIVDRPFLFAIRDRLSGTILFFGNVV